MLVLYRLGKMSFPHSSSGWGEPASSRSLGWKSSATRSAVPPAGAIAPAEKWAKLRQSVPLPLSQQHEAPSLYFGTPETAAIAMQQFQQGEEEGRLAAQLEALGSASRAMRSAIDSNIQFVRSEANAAEKRKVALSNEIAQVRRAVHATDVHKDVTKECRKTVTTVRDMLKTFVVAQDKGLRSAVADMDKKIAASFNEMQAALSVIKQRIDHQDEHKHRTEVMFQSIMTAIDPGKKESHCPNRHKRHRQNMEESEATKTSSENIHTIVLPRKKGSKTRIHTSPVNPSTITHSLSLSSSGSTEQDSQPEHARQKKIRLGKHRMETRYVKTQLSSSEFEEVVIDESCSLTEEPLLSSHVKSRKGGEDSLFTEAKDAIIVEPIPSLFDVSDRDEDDFVMECVGRTVPQSNQQQSSEFWSIGARLKSKSRRRA